MASIFLLTTATVKIASEIAFRTEIQYPFCVQKFHIVQVLFQLPKLVCTKCSVCKIINVKLIFFNIVILISTKTVCFNKTGNKQDNKK